MLLIGHLKPVYRKMHNIWATNS